MATFIEHRDKSIFSCTAEALVNPVNCKGIMGAGLALRFKKRYPDMFKDYAFACSNGFVRLGQMYVYKFYDNGMPRYIINFPTKDDWREQSDIKNIVSGLYHLRTTIASFNIKSIAIPAIGCGLGGLDWNAVYPLIVRELQEVDPLDVDILLPSQKE